MYCIVFFFVFFIYSLQVNVYLNLFKSEDGNRQRYNYLLNQCINLNLKKYNLTAESTIEYCESSHRTIEQGKYISKHRLNIQ